jgi:hypothetical protein
MKCAFRCLLLALTAPIVLRAQQQPMPELSLTANGAQQVNLYFGWPLVAHATIMNSSRLPKNGTPTQLVITPTGAPWTSAIQFTATDSSGQAHQWPLSLIGTPADPALTLAPTSYVRLTVQMAPVDVSSLAPGTYQLTAALQVNNSNGWNGVVQSRPATIQVGPEPSPLTPEQQSRKALLIAEFQTNAGDLNGALSTVEQLMQSQPSNASAMSAAANLLELLGYQGLALFQTREAINAYSQANTSFYDPPANLLAMNQRLFTQAITPNSSQSQTNTSASSAEVTFSPAEQTVTLSATVSSTSGPVDGGSVTFSITGAGNPVTSSPVTQGNATALFAVPGGTRVGSYPIVATYNGTPIFSASDNSASVLKIDRAAPVISWSNPADLHFGSALGPAQLNATASVPGTFVYNPPAGTLLPAGPGQSLSVSFTPSDATDYNGATAVVSINVTPTVPCVNNLAGKGTPSGRAPARIDITWTGIPNVLSYNVLRGVTSRGPYLLIGNAAVPAYSDTSGLTNGNKYYYVLQPIDRSGSQVCQSNEAAITIPNQTR